MGTASRQYFFLGVIFASLLLPFLVGAQTPDPLEQELNVLLAEIEALQRELANLPAAVSPAAPAPSGMPPSALPAQRASQCPSLERNLSRGMRGPDVLDLQAFLAQEGFFYAEATGFFGPVTEASVQEWQSAKGVVRSGTPESNGFGVVGPRTRATILNRCDPTAHPASSIPPPASCPVSLPPKTECNTGWQAVTDQYGCTTTYKCTITVPKSDSCPQYQPLSCPNGTIISNGTDANGCSLGAQCVTVISGTCTGDISTAQNGATGKICTQGGPVMRCPFDVAYTTQVVNGCVQSYLLTRGWIVATTSVGTLSTAPSISVSSTPSNPVRGQPLMISWSSQHAPTGAKVRLEIYKSSDAIVQGNNDRGLTSGVSQLAVSGSYTWTLPTTESPVLADAGWGGYAFTSGQYKIVAKLYTGDTCWGFCYPTATRTIHATAEGTVFTVQ